jgi:hypothetical protein
MLVVVFKDCVTLTKVTPCRSNTSTSLAKSMRARLSRSILKTTTTSMRPDSMSARRRFSAGRSSVPPEKPPSSYWSANSTQPSAR